MIQSSLKKLFSCYYQSIKWNYQSNARNLYNWQHGFEEEKSVNHIKLNPMVKVYFVIYDLGDTIHTRTISLPQAIVVNGSLKNAEAIHMTPPQFLSVKFRFVYLCTTIMWGSHVARFYHR